MGISTCNALSCVTKCACISIPVADLIWNDLIMIQPWLNNQSISGFIAFHPDTTCANFANLLLQNPVLVKSLQDSHQGKSAFVQAVLREWYSGTGTPVSFTWWDLIQCMRKTGLNSHTVHIIEQNILDKVQRPCEWINSAYTYLSPATSSYSPCFFPLF